MLAGLIRAPSRYAPTRDLGLARARAEVVLNSMVETGSIKAADAAAAKAAPAQVAAPAHPRRHRLLRGLGVRRKPAVRRRGAAAPGGAHHARSEAATRRGGGGGGGVRPGAHGQGSRAGGAGRHDPRRPGTRHARRSRLRRQSVQPRDPGGAPARLGVQAVRLSRRARGGAAPGGPHLGGADQGERLGATQPGRPLPDQHHPARLLRGIGQHRRGAPG